MEITMVLLKELSIPNRITHEIIMINRNRIYSPYKNQLYGKITFLSENLIQGG